MVTYGTCCRRESVPTNWKGKRAVSKEKGLEMKEEIQAADDQLRAKA